MPKKKFNEHERNQMKQAFALFDLDGNGFITNDELGTVLRKMGQEPTEEEIVQMINEIDEDGDGTIDFDEFCELMENRMSDENSEADIIEVFKVFDEDGSGNIGASELAHVLSNLDEPLTPAEVKWIVDEADVDGDGTISFDEFKKMMMSCGAVK
jgi:calmodulin|tara:strand:- start:32 stop:496 length:465 start_codon:yes stop_codon:yes gene_type:complete